MHNCCGFAKHLNDELEHVNKEEVVYSIVNASFSSDRRNSSDISLDDIKTIKQDITVYNDYLVDVILATCYSKNVPMRLRRHIDPLVFLESLYENTFIKIIDYNDHDLNENVVYPISYLLSLESIVVNPSTKNFCNDIVFNVYNYLSFLKMYDIQFMYKHLVVIANVPGLDNAYWNGSYLTFGAGCKGLPLTSSAIVGHELTHAVIQQINNLEYRGHSGALNESYADILGVCFEFYVSERYGLGWEIGKECNLLLRNMASPEKCSQPSIMYDHFYFNPNSHQDNGGVHINSGIINHIFYKMHEFIGYKKTLSLFIDVIFELLPNSTFHHFKKIMINKIVKNYENTGGWRDAISEINPMTELITIVNYHIF